MTMWYSVYITSYWVLIQNKKRWPGKTKINRFGTSTVEDSAKRNLLKRSLCILIMYVTVIRI